MKKKILAILFLVLFAFAVTGCEKEEDEDAGSDLYHVDYNGDIIDFTGAKNYYHAGEEVTIYYGFIATDTDYSFYLDDEYLNVGYSDDKGFIISFTMPAHDISIRVESRNSMEYIEEVTEDTEEDITEKTTEATTEATTEKTTETTTEAATEAESDGEVSFKIEECNIYEDLPTGSPIAELYDGEYPSYIAIWTNKTIYKFRIVSLVVQDVTADGELTFLYEDEGFLLDSLTPELPVGAKVGFIGDTPNVGIMYEDSAGKLHMCAIEVSGYDGSLKIVEIPLD